MADLADVDADRTEIVRAAEAAFGAPVEILVNNAAAARHFELRFEGMHAAALPRAGRGQRLGRVGA